MKAAELPTTFKAPDMAADLRVDSRLTFGGRALFHNLSSPIRTRVEEATMTRELKPCGTRAAYQRHTKAGEQPCRPCTEANCREPRGSCKTDVDEIAVARAVNGDTPERLTISEREQVVRRLHRRGLSDPRIAEHLDITAHGVLRIRRRLNLPAAVPPGRAAGA